MLLAINDGHIKKMTENKYKPLKARLKPEKLLLFQENVILFYERSSFTYKHVNILVT